MRKCIPHKQSCLEGRDGLCPTSRQKHCTSEQSVSIEVLVDLQAELSCKLLYMFKVPDGADWKKACVSVLH